IAETKIAAAAVELGVPVLRPIVEHGRYDLAFEIGDEILRVQCKWGSLRDGGAVLRVNLTSSWCTPTGYDGGTTLSVRSTSWRCIAMSSTAVTFCRQAWSPADSASISGSNQRETVSGPVSILL